MYLFAPNVASGVDYNDYDNEIIDCTTPHE